MAIDQADGKWAETLWPMPETIEGKTEIRGLARPLNANGDQVVHVKT
ncbi:MAG: hypothetical protein LKK13_03790 [Bacilli bacterium]|nr:hypothetical protein [Bacilli bacterium]